MPLAADQRVNDPVGAVDAFADVVGQETVVARLRAAAAHPVHAFLLVGPPGCGKRALARAFAAQLLVADVPADDRERTVTLARRGAHPDVIEVGAEGARVRRDEAETLVAAALRSPVERDRKVVIGRGFEAMEPIAAGILLKVVEEPPASTVFVLLAESVPPGLVTIASRCVRFDIPPLSNDDVVTALCASGVDATRARAAAEAADGDLERARVLATDERLELRRQAWLSVLDRLDGTGAVAAATVAELLSMVDEAMAPLVAVQQAEVEALEAELEQHGVRGAKGARKQLEEAHKRQQRRFRSGEIAFGLASLARRLRDDLVAGRRGIEVTGQLDAITALTRSMRFNPNEPLQLQVLFLALSPR